MFKKLISMILVWSFFFPSYAMAQYIQRSQNLYERDMMGGQQNGNGQSFNRNGNQPSTFSNQRNGINFFNTSGGMGSSFGGASFPGSSMIQKVNVHIIGDVYAPGVYNVQLAQRLSEALEMAGPIRSSTRLVQIRYPDGKFKIYDLYRYYFYGKLSENPRLVDGSVINVLPHRGVVRVSGAVKRSGLYELNGEKTLLNLLSLAGGASLHHNKLDPVIVVRFDETRKRTLEKVPFEKKDLKHFKVLAGDIIYFPDRINHANKFDFTTETIPGESIVYPTSVPDVFVIGAVSAPGPYPYKSHLTVKDYVGFSGATQDAKLSRVKIFRDGKKKSYTMNSKVQAGDVIIVKQKGLTEVMKYVGIISTVMGVTLTALILKDTIRDQ